MKGGLPTPNIRKVIFMLVSTGAAEMVLFLLAIPLGLPMPLLPVQLLWLNLVTNGIQDVALAGERAEGDELSRSAAPAEGTDLRPAHGSADHGSRRSLSALAVSSTSGGCCSRDTGIAGAQYVASPLGDI